MPRHVNPTHRERIATAPYNFVPLPGHVFTVENGIDVRGEKIRPWEMHDRYVPGTNSGWIDLTIKTLTPLYIRAPVTKAIGGSWDARDARCRREPYKCPDGTPAIPGSSLRGMVRTLVEILSFSKIQPVSKAKPFFRTVADDRVGRAYRERMIRGGQKPRGGILYIRPEGAVISQREVARVPRTLLQDRGVRISKGPDYTPPWPQQHGCCWVKLKEGSETVCDIFVGKRGPDGEGWRRGTLVLTGNAPNKRREFVFLDPEGGTPCEILVPHAIWERFHAEDQVTQWQERAFPTDKPTMRCRKAPGHLRNGEPVFFLTDSRCKSKENPKGLVFLGRAQMFRLPYDLSPEDLVPQVIRTAALDLTEAIFGKVDQEGAIRGRVYFEDAVAEGGPDWYESVLVPKILSAPKPTAFQHYLTQDGTRDRDQLTTYLKGDYTAIRGHKLYWHRWDEQRGISQIREPNNHDELLEDLQHVNPRDTQHTIIRPVKAGVVFAGRVRFENLTDLELGALLAALELPEGCCHRLGMGKPLGLGSVRIGTRLCLVNRDDRYRAWQVTGEITGEDGSRFRTVFEDAMLQHARTSGETLLTSQQGLRRIARLDVLYEMLSWENRPSSTSTGYMDLARFRQRPVLPTPHGVAGREEPPWPADPPRPASGNRGTGAARPPKLRRRATSA